MTDIVIFGGDGYIGWPLVLALATAHPDKSILVVDSFLARKHAVKLGTDSLLPLSGMPKRIEAYRATFGLDNLSFLELDCTNSLEMSALFARISPEVVYHLAHQRAAPYSMLGLHECIETVINNEVGFLNLIWLIKDHCPEAHLVKLGSFGAYAKPGIDIPEGDAHIAIDGVVSARPAPFPRASDDFYHITKINDGNFARLACGKWGLRITEVMQSTVFGAATALTSADSRLHTRFDYDEIRGTVLNRFVTQALTGLPLTVYGSGEQTSGIMTLDDCVQMLVHLAQDPAPQGTPRIVNGCPQIYTINELAEMVRVEARAFDLDVEIARNRYNPRFESGAPFAYRVNTCYIDVLMTLTPLAHAIARGFEALAPFRGDIQRGCVQPTHDWTGAENSSPRSDMRPSSDAETGSKGVPKAVASRTFRPSEPRNEKTPMPSKVESR